MDNQFIEVRTTEHNQQMFLNVNHIAAFQQTVSYTDRTDIILNTGHILVVSIAFHELRKRLGLDEKR